MQTTIHDLSGVPCDALCIPIFDSSCGNTQGSDTTIEFECTNAIWWYGTIGKVEHVYICPIGLDWL